MREDPLIRFLKKRTRSRFTALVRVTRAEVLNAVCRVLGDLDRAEDVTQDVFLKLLTVQWDPGAIRSPRGLLISTAILAARAAARQDARRAERERRAGGERRERAACPGCEEAVEVREAVAGLPAHLSECVELRYFGGLAIGQVAEAMGWTLRTTNHRLKEARDLLRVRLAAPAAAAALPILEGEVEAAWPAVDVSEELDGKLEDLCRAGPSMARIAGGKQGWAPGAAVAAAGLIVLLIGGAWMALGRNESPEAPRIAAPAEVAAPGDREKVAIGPGAPGSVVDTVGAARETDPADPAGQPASPPGRADTGGGVKSAPEGAPGSGGFSIEVVDEEGALLREGDLHLRIEPLDMSLEEIESLLPVAPLAEGFEEHPLARGNPHELRGIPPCSLSAQGTAPGRAPSAREVIRIDAGRVAALRLLVPRPRTMDLRVLDGASGEPIPDAKVLSISEIGRRGLAVDKALLALETETPSGAGRTGPDGTCRLEGLGAGPHRLEVYREGYRTARLDGADPSSGAVMHIEKAVGGGSIAVNARGPKGEPVSRVSLSLEIEGESASRRVDLDEVGHARFEGIPAGTHTVGLDHSAWANVIIENRWNGLNPAQARPVEVKDGEETTVDLGFLRGTSRVEVSVVNGAGKASAGVKVRLDGPCLREEQTGSDGRCLFEEVPAGKWSAWVGEGFGWVLEPWSLGDRETRSLRLVLGEGVIQGRVTRGTDAQGVPGIAVSASGPAWDFTTTRADGSFVFEGAAPGRYTIQAALKDGEVRTAEAEVPPVGDAPDLEIRLEP